MWRANAATKSRGLGVDCADALPPAFISSVTNHWQPGRRGRGVGPPTVSRLTRHEVSTAWVRCLRPFPPPSLTGSRGRAAQCRGTRCRLCRCPASGRLSFVSFLELQVSTSRLHEYEHPEWTFSKTTTRNRPGWPHFGILRVLNQYTGLFKRSVS